MVCGGDKISRKKTWDGMQVRRELRMGRGGDKIKDDFRINAGKKSLGWYAVARRVEDGTRWR